MTKKPSKEAVTRSVQRMIRDLGPIKYVGEKRTQTTDPVRKEDREAKDRTAGQVVTADQYRRDPTVSPTRRERVRRMLLTPDALRAEDEAEEALLRELAEDATSEARGRGKYPGT